MREIYGLELEVRDSCARASIPYSGRIRNSCSSPGWSLWRLTCSLLYILLRLFLAVIALQGAHKVVLESFLRQGCSIICMLLQDIHHDFGVNWCLPCSPSDQTSCLDNLGRYSGCDHVRYSFLWRCRTNLATRDNCLVWRGLL